MVLIMLQIWPKDRTKDELVAAFKEAFAGMRGLGYVDLCMVHAPIDPVNRTDHWRALETLKAEGLVRSLGLAYMTHIQLGDLIKHCNVIPTVLEVYI
jgi:diketogulonate reductase-like aldo/keto reductase